MTKVLSKSNVKIGHQIPLPWRISDSALSVWQWEAQIQESNHHKKKKRRKIVNRNEKDASFLSLFLVGSLFTFLSHLPWDIINFNFCFVNAAAKRKYTPQCCFYSSSVTASSRGEIISKHLFSPFSTILFSEIHRHFVLPFFSCSVLLSSSFSYSQGCMAHAPYSGAIAL